MEIDLKIYEVRDYVTSKILKRTILINGVKKEVESSYKVKDKSKALELLQQKMENYIKTKKEELKSKENKNKITKKSLSLSDIILGKFPKQQKNKILTNNVQLSTVEKLKEITAVNTVAKSIKKLSKKNILNHFNEQNYNEEQLTFIKSGLENSSLMGIPGGGKTQSIIGKIIYHMLNDEIYQVSNYKVFTFSRRAASDFIKKGKKYDNLLFSEYSIKTIHSLAASIVKYALNKRSQSLKALILSAYNLFENNIEKMKGYTQLNNCKIIFIDEAQDVSEIEYKFIMKISEFYNIPAIMVGDPNQNIYQFKKGSDRFLLNHNGPKYYLIKNYRSTPEIVSLVNSLRPLGDLTPLMESTITHNDSNKPILIVDSIKNIVNDVIYKIKNLNIPYHEIAIIGPVKNSKPTNFYYTNIGLSLFTNKLIENGISFVKHYNDGDGDYHDIDKEINIVENKINLLTIHGSKGLEFKAVFLLNFHHNTFGKTPTLEEYSNFKYLWYVGFSRAKEYLFIYTEKDKYIWNDYKLIQNDLIIQNHQPKELKNLKLNESTKPLLYSVLDIINKYIDDEKYLTLRNIIGDIDLRKEKLWDEINLPYYTKSNDISKIYGIFMEYIFNYYYCCNSKTKPYFIENLQDRIENLIELTQEYSCGFNELNNKLKNIIKANTTLNKLLEYKLSLGNDSLKLLKYVSEQVNDDRDKIFYLTMKNDVISHPKEKILEHINLINEYKNEVKIEDNNLYLYIFYLAVYVYQCENESSFMLDEDYSDDVTNLIPYIINVKEFVKNLHDDNIREGEKYIYDFQIPIYHKNLPIKGIIDMMNTEKIIDLKFSNSSSMEKYIDQLLMYYIIYDPSLESPKTLELWNICKGEKITISFDKNRVNKMNLLCILANTINEKLSNMIFFYDLETSGLIDHMFGTYPDLIEIYIEEYNSRSVWCNSLVKLQSIDNLDQNITEITGIKKEDLDDNGKNINDIKDEVKYIFNICDKPVFIAHNGNAFDHRIMQYNNMFDEHTIHLDSRGIFNLLTEKIDSCKLCDIFKHYFDEKIIAHRAQADVYMMIKVFKKLGINVSIFQNII